MASFTTRSGSVRATVRFPGGRRETQTFDTMAQAQAWAAEMERKKVLGEVRAGAGLTVGDLLEAYETEISSKLDSARWNRYRVHKWLLDPLARLRVGEVTTHDINGWITRREADVSGSTVNRELNLLSAAFSYAVRTRKWIAENPCKGALRPQQGRARSRRLLDPLEVLALITATGYDRDACLKTATARVGACFLLALETGMRSGEILRLRPQDYNREARVAHVAALEVGGRKGSRSGRSRLDPSRDVPLTARACEILDQLVAHPLPGSNYIVGLTDSQRDALWRKAVKQSGVSDLTFHDTKHEAATRLSKYLDVIALSHALGTKDVRLLRDTYYVNDASRSAQLLPEQLRQ